MVEAIYLFLSLILIYSCLTLKCNLVVLSDLQNCWFSSWKNPHFCPLYWSCVMNKHKKVSFYLPNFRPFLQHSFSTTLTGLFLRCVERHRLPSWIRTNPFSVLITVVQIHLTNLSSVSFQRKLKTEVEHPTCREGQYTFDQDTVPISSRGADV